MKKFFAILSISALFLAAGCSATPDQSASAPTTSDQSMNTQMSTQQGSDAYGSVSVAPMNTTSDSDQLAGPKKGDTVAIMVTDFGTIKFKLFTTQVPVLTKNFIELAKAGKYVGAPFHRVVQDFMIQGGDFTNHDGTGGYSYMGPNTYLPNEIVPSLHHLYGTVSMAKTGAPVSIGSQFFIVNNMSGASFLDGSYSPIGQVYSGMDVVQKITALQIPGTETPSKLVKIDKVTIETYNG